MQVPDNFKLPSSVGVVDVRRSGHLAVVTTNTYREGEHAAFTAGGATISAVERLTLEEIFLSSVSDSQEAPA